VQGTPKIMFVKTRISVWRGYILHTDISFIIVRYERSECYSLKTLDQGLSNFQEQELHSPFINL
jgi:hypothetical protein